MSEKCEMHSIDKVWAGKKECEIYSLRLKGPGHPAFVLSTINLDIFATNDFFANSDKKHIDYFCASNFYEFIQG